MDNTSKIKTQIRCTEQNTLSKQEQDAAVDKFINSDPAVIPLSGIASLPVQKFDFDLLPSSLIPWAKDMQKRLQCAPDFIGVGIMIGLSSAVGNKVITTPKAQDSSWSVVPNLWGLLIGNPSAMKTPALNAALSNVYGLDNIARNAKQRLVVHDATIEQLQILQSRNQHGLLMVNDEIASMFKKFDNPNYGNDRPYLLQAFNGDKPYSVDRVGRESIHIPMNTLSLIGNIQPSVLKEHFGKNKNLNDGFMQRLQLAVYPDITVCSKLVDDLPDQKAKDRAEKLYNDLYVMDHRELKFDIEPQIKFYDWYEKNAKLAQFFESEGRDDLASHLMKYPTMVVSIASLIELAENQESFRISQSSLDKAIAWSKYLFSHAKRIYEYSDQVSKSAQDLLKRKGSLQGNFSPSEVTQKGWSGLNKTELVQEAIDYLVDRKYLFKEEKPIGAKGGRPSIRYRWNNTLDD